MVESGDLRKKNTNELLRMACFRLLSLVTEIQTSNVHFVETKEKVNAAIDKIDGLKDKTDSLSDQANSIKDVLEQIKEILEP